MKKSTSFMTRLFFWLTLACERSQYASTGKANEETTQDKSMVVTGLVVRAADAAECAAGGFIYQFYSDSNNNQKLDEVEPVVQEQKICNGVAGEVGATGETGATGSNGADGANGTNGANGANGHSVVLQTTPASPAQCANGGSILLAAVDSDDSGDLSVADTQMQSVFVCNGLAGQNGAPAPISPFSTVDMIMACGNNSPYKEVLLVLQSGDVLASFSNNMAGDMTRLALLPDGTFQNSDGSGCVFSLSTSGNQRTVSWDNQVQKTWTLL